MKGNSLIKNKYIIHKRMVIQMTDNSKKVLGFLKENYGNKVTHHDIVSALGLTSPMVTGSVNGLVKKAYAVRDAVEVMGADGKAIIVKYISLTEAGLGFNPDATVTE